MARFPYYRRNVSDLGRLLARAALDDRFRKALIASPQETLASLGLPQETTSLINFKVVDQREHGNAVVLPYRLNDVKLESNDSGYAEELGKSFVLN